MGGFEFAVLCLALNIYHESRGDPYEGQAAVALTTLNRAKLSSKEVCEVVFEPRQFSWTIEGAIGQRIKASHHPKDKTAWEKAKQIALAAFYMKDFTGGATHFHEASINPKWPHKRIGRWGSHIFYKQENYK